MEVTTQVLRDLLAESGLAPEAARALRPDAPLLLQGVDSLQYPAFLLAVESRFGLTIDEGDALALRTLDDFVAYVRSRPVLPPPPEAPAARTPGDGGREDPDRAYEVGPLRPGDGEGVARLFRVIYGDRYPVKEYYVAERIEQRNAEGSLLTVVARLRTGGVAGQGAYFRSSPPNRALYEFGQVMVAPEFRDTFMAAKILRAMDRLSRRMPQARGFFGEAVCTHVLTQRLVDTHGYSECGLEMSLMPAGAYEREGAGDQRVSCLLGARVDRDLRGPLHLPPGYRRELEFILDGFRLERDVFSDSPEAPAALTALERRVFDEARVERVQVLTVGADFPGIAAGLDREAAEAGLAALQVFVNAGAPGTAFAVEALRSRGFFLGGLVPLWFGPDGLLMQKLYLEPDFETLKLYSDRGRTIRDLVRADHARARSRA